MSASLVTGYSSEEEEEIRQKDVNYDDVNMEMSEEEVDMSTSVNKKEDKGKKKNKSSEVKTTTTTSSTGHKKKKKKKKHHSNKDAEEEEQEDRRKRSRSKSSDDDVQSSEEQARSSRRDDRRDGHRRNKKHHDSRRRRDQRRSRSRERSNREDERLSKQGRKLKALGLMNQDLHKDDGLKRKAAEATVAQQVKQVTGVELPKYYNPSAINPMRYVEQIKKRKLLWSKPGGSNSAVKTDNESNGMTTTPNNNATSKSFNPQSSSSSYNNWESTNFGNSQANEKFRRLMGIKSGQSAPSNDNASGVTSGNKKMFKDLDQQYEKARITTHTARGLGLGFSNCTIPSGDEGTKFGSKK